MITVTRNHDSLYLVFGCWALCFGRLHLAAQKVVDVAETMEAGVCKNGMIDRPVIVDVVKGSNPKKCPSQVYQYVSESVVCPH